MLVLTIFVVSHHVPKSSLSMDENEDYEGKAENDTESGQREVTR